VTGWGAAFAAWWVRRYTATAAEVDQAARRAEVAADVHDHLAHAHATGQARAAADRAVGARALRGMPADVAWRLAREADPDRVAWHLAHPATLLAGLLPPLVVLGLLVDTARHRATWLAVPAELAAVVWLPLSALAVGVGVVGGLRAARRPHRPSLAGLRRGALATMAVSWGLAGLWRFVPGSLGAASAAGWVAFGLALLAWLALVAVTAGLRVLALGKVTS
jgi:hypothetical protein